MARFGDNTETYFEERKPLDQPGALASRCVLVFYAIVVGRLEQSKMVAWAAKRERLFAKERASGPGPLSRPAVDIKCLAMIVV